MVWNRAEARALPSRYRYALSRLLALAAPRRVTIEHGVRTATAIDRDQCAAEHYTVAVLVWLITSSYVAGIITARVRPAWWAPLLLLDLLATPLLLQIPMYIAGGLLLRGRNNQELNTLLTFVLLLIPSSYAAVSASWTRWVAWLFFALVIADALAAVILWPMGRRIAEMERRCAG